MPNAVYTVLAVNQTNITLTSPFELATSAVPGTMSTAYKYYGGRGTEYTSKIACLADPTYCLLSRRLISGSMQSKLQMLPGALQLGVHVDRALPAADNGLRWRITFLDNSPAFGSNFIINITGNDVVTLNGSPANITVTQITSGENYQSCTGTSVLPPDQMLSNGQAYFARVFATNEVGYSMPAVTSIPVRPVGPPDIPTQVYLSVLSHSELQVLFYPPADDGGDVITSYMIIYSTSSSFTDPVTSLFTYFEGGAPYKRTIRNLQTGVSYFVKVCATNNQGSSSFVLVSIGAWLCIYYSVIPSLVNLVCSLCSYYNIIHASPT